MGHCDARISRGLALPFAVLVAACASGGSRNTSSIPQMVVSELPPPSPTARMYSTDSSPHPGGLAGEIAREVVGAGTELQLSMVMDGRLAALGLWAAEHSTGGRLPPHGPIDDAAHRLGLVEPTPALIVYRTNDGTQLPQVVRANMAEILQQRAASHVGVGVIQSGGSTTAIIVLSDRRLTLQPLPRLPGPIPSIEIRGQLTDGLSKPQLVVMQPGGEIERTPLGDATSFGARIPLGKIGVYGIEVLATGNHGTTVVANFPLRVGVPEPAMIRVETPVQDAGGDVGQGLLALINRDREAASLTPLIRRDDLDAVALGHSRDMDENGFVGHTSPTTGSVLDRIQAAGIETPMALENIGRDYSTAAIHAALMASPGHRANILNPGVSHIGIDLVRQTEGTLGNEGQRKALLVTQVFIRVVVELDPETAADDAIERLGEQRKAGRLPDIDRDDTLDELATRGAAHYFSNSSPSQGAVMQYVDRAMRKASLPYKEVQVLGLVGSSIDLSQVEALLDPKVRAIGIGFAQGRRADAKVNPVTIAVVLLAY